MTGDTQLTENLSPIKRALAEVRQMRQHLENMESRQKEPIAIIGMGMRYPGDVRDSDSFWRLLEEGIDAIQEVPADRWDIDSFYDPDTEKPGKMATRFGGFINGIDQFDPAFFGISPREAESLDPQQRLLLEVAWESLENACEAPDHLFDSQTGVFIGISNSDYFRLMVADLEKIDTYSTTGTALSIAAGRLSYFLGLHGPNMAIDTACSSSLVALHLAVRSLRSGECNLALAGGVSLMLSPDLTINFSKAQMMAADGRCKTFDARADGYVRGEGCGMVVLKRLSAAQAAGDRILAVIRGSAINQDGRSGGITAPNGPAQEAVIAQALADGEVDPLEVSYVEAHGTGTSLGDPIEVHTLVSALCRQRPASRPLALGSVKTNFGHLEAAAGIAGLMKVVLSLQHRQIPAHLHLASLNPHISLNGAPIVIHTQKTAWENEGRSLVAGVSAFGLSGTNCHIVLQEAPAVESPAPDIQGLGDQIVERTQQILTLSARSEGALRSLAGRYEQLLTNQDDRVNLAEVGYSANTGRSHFTHRLAIVASDRDEAVQKLQQYQANSEPSGWSAAVASAEPVSELAFLFTGHGGHYAGMGRQLFESSPVFQAALMECNQILLDMYEVDILAALYTEQAATGMLNEMAYTQPALFSLQVALVKLWKSWGVEPTIVMGHSGGEYAAAWLAGIFSLADALRLVMSRGRMMQSSKPGVMATVFADQDRVAQAIQPFTKDASIAAINGPKNTVISGSQETVQTVLEILRAQRIKSRMLPIGQAAHSPLVEPMLDEFMELAASIKLSAPTIPMVSSLTGMLVDPAEIVQPQYWCDHLRRPVQFESGMLTLGEQGQRTFLEIGPNPMLLAMGQRCLPENEGLWLPSLREGWDDWQPMLESLGALYVQGLPVDWVGFDQPYFRRKTTLPSYPWERKSYWWTGHRAPIGAKKPRSLWVKALEAGRWQSQQVPLELDISSFAQKWESLNRLAAKYLTNALLDLGIFTTPDERYTLDAFIEKGHILPTYRYLMIRWLKLLAANGDLEHGSDGTITRSHPLRRQPMDQAWEEAKTSLADIPFVTDYLRECGERLSAMLVGAESPLEMMFPGGSMARAEALYQHWAHARYFHHIVRAVVESIYHADPKKALRILEIGAGTGATTASVLPILERDGESDRVTYHFTDVSNIFLDRAREKFGPLPFLRYSLLDIEKDAHAQGYGSHQFDIVIAANVLHATRDLRATLQNVRSLLSPTGIFILFEATQHQPWFDVTTGLIEGWQSFGDDLRTDSPLLSVSQWLQNLEAEGFTDVAALPEASSPAEILGEHVIMGRSFAQVGEQVEITELESNSGSLIENQDSSQISKPGGDLLDRLRTAMPDERKEIVIDFVRRHVSSVLRLDPSTPPDRRARLMDLGIDSLMAVELRGRLSKSLDTDRKLPATLVFDHPTIEAIADYLLEKILTNDQPAPGPANDEPTARPTRAAELEDLTDEQVEAMLLKKLKKIP